MHTDETSSPQHNLSPVLGEIYGNTILSMYTAEVPHKQLLKKKTHYNNTFSAEDLEKHLLF